MDTPNIILIQVEPQLALGMAIEDEGEGFHGGPVQYIFLVICAGYWKPRWVPITYQYCANCLEAKKNVLFGRVAWIEITYNLVFYHFPLKCQKPIFFKGPTNTQCRMVRLHNRWRQIFNHMCHQHRSRHFSIVLQVVNALTTLGMPMASLVQ